MGFLRRRMEIISSIRWVGINRVLIKWFEYWGNLWWVDGKPML